MKHFLPVLILIAGLNTTSWADNESEAPVDIGDTGEAAQIQTDVENDVDSAASPYANRGQFEQRIRSQVLGAITEAIEDNPNISEAEREEIARELEDWELEDWELEDWSDFGERMDAGTTLVGFTAVVLIFGMPIILVAAVLYAGHRKRRVVHDMVSQFLANGQEVPAEVWRGLTGDKTPRNNLHRGMIMLGVGIGVFSCFWLMRAEEAAYLALIPLFIGVAQLLIWKLEKNKDGPGIGPRNGRGNSLEE